MRWFARILAVLSAICGAVSVVFLLTLPTVGVFGGSPTHLIATNSIVRHGVTAQDVISMAILALGFLGLVLGVFLWRSLVTWLSTGFLLLLAVPEFNAVQTAGSGNKPIAFGAVGAVFVMGAGLGLIAAAAQHLASHRALPAYATPVSSRE